MKKWILIGSLLGIVGMLAGCGVENKAEIEKGSIENQLESGIERESAEKEENQARNSGEFNREATEFGLELFKNIDKTEENAVISPVSAMLALGIAYNGSEGETQAQFSKVLSDGNLSLEEINREYKAFSDKLQKEYFKDVKEKDLEEQTLKLSNSMWVDTNYKIKETFKTRIQEALDCSLYSEDFRRFDTISKMNHWVNENTNGLIKKAVEYLGKNTKSIIMNITLFEMPWDTKIEKSEIEKGKFYLDNGETVEADFMNTKDSYIECKLGKGIKKYYKNRNFSFIAVLPNEGTKVEEMVDSLTYEDWKELLEVGHGGAYAKLPKFKFEGSINLVDTLKRMGMEDAFVENKANFKGISDDRLYIQDIMQKTYVDVNEDKTTATAVTKMAITNDCLELIEHSVEFNRPFMFAILDDNSGIPIFIGILGNTEGE